MERKKATDAIRILVKAAQRLCLVNHRSAESTLSRAARLELSDLMDGLTELDVGLSSTTAAKLSNITYMHIHEEPAFSMGVFILPPNATIPLHDHPGMEVISKVLNGSLHIFSCDWEDSTPSSLRTKGERGGWARVCADETVRGPAMRSLGPTCNNLHSFTGGDVSGCAILDILTPPYDFENGRSCNYFRVQDLESASHHSLEFVTKSNETQEEETGSDSREAVMLVPYSPRFMIGNLEFSPPT